MRFIKEYANWKIRQIKGYGLMKKVYKDQKIAEIKRYQQAAFDGRVTIDEAMEWIARV